MRIIELVAVLSSIISIFSGLFISKTKEIKKLSEKDIEILLKVRDSSRSKKKLLLKLICIPFLLNLLAPFLINIKTVIQFNSIFPFISNSGIFELFISIEILCLAICISIFIRYYYIEKMADKEIKIKK